MTLGDVGAYRAKDRPPVCVTYRQYKMCGMGPPSSGATTVFGVLGLLERFDLSALGKDDPRAWHLIAEAQRLAYADRERYLADPDFIDVPVAGLLAPDYLGARAQLIAVDRTMPSVAPEQPAERQGGAGGRTGAGHHIDLALRGDEPDWPGSNADLDHQRLRLWSGGQRLLFSTTS